jgi:hypothetical protein
MGAAEHNRPATLVRHLMRIIEGERVVGRFSGNAFNRRDSHGMLTIRSAELPGACHDHHGEW